LVDCRRRTWQDQSEILSHFSLKKREAVRQYREFIKDGFNMGRREDLTGGGLRRSISGWGFWKELAQYFGISRPSVLQAIKQDEKSVKF
jgi:hypothetical protein